MKKKLFVCDDLNAICNLILQLQVWMKLKKEKRKKKWLHELYLWGKLLSRDREFFNSPLPCVWRELLGCS